MKKKIFNSCQLSVNFLKPAISHVLNNFPLFKKFVPLMKTWADHFYYVPLILQRELVPFLTTIFYDSLPRVRWWAGLGSAD